MLRLRTFRGAAGAGLAALLLLADPASGAPHDPDGFRVGMTLGGISFVGVTLEYGWGDRSLDLTVGTWALRDVSVSLVAKQYLGPDGLRPYFGAGLWGVAAFPDEGPGAVLVLRAPVGVEAEIGGEHFIGGAMNINRGLWVRRSRPDDETPLNRRLVPLPGLHYRWHR